MSSSELITIIFRLINFAIIVFGAIYLYKHYLQKSIKESLSKYKEYFFNLREKAKRLADRSDELEVEIKEQTKVSDQLLEKVIKWKASYDLEREEKIVKQQLINDKIAEKVKIQEELITLNSFNKIMIPEVFADVNGRLKKEFKSEDKAIEFQNEIIEFIKKS